jgi:amidohydrolase
MTSAPPVPADLPSDVLTRMREVSARLHQRPETAFAEHFAATELTRWLEEEGFRITRPVGGLDTAFVAAHHGPEAGPSIAILAEYDALPGIGHGCGHNLIAAGGAAAAVAAVRARPDHRGTVTVIGTPAEEGGGGKVLLAEAGVFVGQDAALMFHPSDVGLTLKHALASAHLEVHFHGRAAHAAKTPWQGRSALAAAQVFLAAVDALRQFVRPTARMHAVVRDGGGAPNVVPEHASVEIMVRESTLDLTGDLVERVRRAAEGAAIATETRYELHEIAPRYAERVPNRTLAERFGQLMGVLGIPMREAEPGEPAGSSDIGNISRLLPTLHPAIPITDRPTSGHSTGFRDAAATDLALDRTAAAARCLAALTLDLLGDGFLDGSRLSLARAEFEAELQRRGM